VAGYVKTCILMQPNRNTDKREISHNQLGKKNALALLALPHRRDRGRTVGSVGNKFSQSGIKVAVVADLVRDAGPATCISASTKPSAEVAEHFHRPDRHKQAVGHFPGHTLRTCRVGSGSADESIGLRLLHASSPASRKPLRLANPSPPSGWVGDFHLLVAEHAGAHAKPPGTRRSPAADSTFQTAR
jgi:hypothetical protein